MESDPTNKLPHVNPSIHLGENSLAPLNEKSTLLWRSASYFSIRLGFPIIMAG